MKLERFHLVRFGEYRDALLPPETLCDGLNIVEGANESGKSTLLGALRFAFFGKSIKGYSPEGESREVKLSLRRRGRLWTLHRRDSTGRKAFDLRAQDGDESVPLAEFQGDWLGGLSAETFCGVYALGLADLDWEQPVRDVLLTAEAGDLGKMLLRAIAALQTDAEALVKGKGEKPLTQAFLAWTAANNSAAQLARRPAELEEMASALATAQTKSQETKQELLRLRREADEYDRLARSRDAWQNFTQCRTVAEELRELATFPPSAVQDFQIAKRRLEEAADSRRDAEERLQKLQRQREAISVDERLLEKKGGLEALRAEAARLSGEPQRLVTLQTEAARLRREAAALARERCGQNEVADTLARLDVAAVAQTEMLRRGKILQDAERQLGESFQGATDPARAASARPFWLLGLVLVVLGGAFLAFGAWTSGVGLAAAGVVTLLIATAQKTAASSARAEALLAQRESLAQAQIQWREWLARQGFPAELSPLGACAFVDGVREVQERLRAAQTSEEQARASSALLESLRQNILAFAEAAGQTRVPDDPHGLASVRVWSESLKSAEEAAVDRRTLERDAGTLRDTCERARAQEQRAEREANEALCRAGAKNADELSLRARRFGDLQQARAGAQKAEAALRAFWPSAEGGPAWEAWERRLAQADWANWEQSRAECQANLAAREAAYSEIQQRIGGLQKEIEALERETALADEQARRERADAEIHRLFPQWAACAAGQALLELTRRNHERERQPAGIRRTAELFRAITDGRWTEVLSRGAELVAERQVNEIQVQRDTEELSRGARETLFLCARLAAIERAVERNPLPVAFDDALVNLDSGRARKFLGEALKLAQKTQVVLFTCHEFLADWAEAAAPAGVARRRIKMPRPN